MGGRLPGMERNLATAIGDPTVVERYNAKLVTVPGSDCTWWSGAISGGAYPFRRFYPGRAQWMTTISRS